MIIIPDLKKQVMFQGESARMMKWYTNRDMTQMKVSERKSSKGDEVANHFIQA